MAEEIIISIDDSELDMALLKLDLLAGAADKVISGGGRGKKLDLVLPGINRELRLILGQVPGMRDAMRAYFALKRVERGKAYLRLGETFPALLTAIATAVLLIRSLQQHMRTVERNRLDYERLIRKARGWTHDEFVRGRNEWQEYRKSMPG
jgi:hypothetical protein